MDEQQKHKMRISVSIAIGSILVALMVVLVFYNNNIKKREYTVNSQNEDPEGGIRLEHDVSKSWVEVGKLNIGSEYDFIK